MTKYLLIAWKDAIDKAIETECSRVKHDRMPPNHYKQVWFDYCQWMKAEIKKGDIIEELVPFADEYAREKIRLKLNSYLLYRSV